MLLIFFVTTGWIWIFFCMNFGGALERKCLRIGPVDGDSLSQLEWIFLYAFIYLFIPLNLCFNSFNALNYSEVGEKNGADLLDGMKFVWSVFTYYNFWNKSLKKMKNYFFRIEYMYNKPSENWNQMIYFFFNQWLKMTI